MDIGPKEKLLCFWLKFRNVHGWQLSPCPLGWAGDPSGRCRCGEDAIRRYRGRISGPLLDRIDLHVSVARLPPSALRTDAPPGECTADVQRRVVAAREIQVARDGVPNARLGQAQTLAACRLQDGDQSLLERAVDRLQLSARSMVRILRVARTIADLDDGGPIRTAHLAEAIGYRVIDRDVAAQAA